jgi:lantibiotic modifying enzyme
MSLANEDIRIADLRPTYQGIPFPGTEIQSIPGTVKEVQQYIDSAWKDDGSFVTWPGHEEWKANYGTLGLFTGAAGVAWLILSKFGTVFEDADDEERLNRLLTYIIEHIEHLKDADYDYVGVAGGLTLGSGLAGIATVFAQASLHDNKWRRFAQEYADRLVSLWNGQPLGWLGIAPVWGDAGIIATLLWIGHTLDEQKYIDAAVAAGQEYLKAEIRDEVGSHWPDLEFPSKLGDLEVSITTVKDGFIEGEDGVPLVLAQLAAETGRADFADAALRGLQHIKAKAEIIGDSALPPLPNITLGTPSYRFGYCHGSAGYIRVFTAASRFGVDAEDSLEWARKYARGALRSGVPGRLGQDNYWLFSQCCGGAGVLEAFNGLWLTTHEELWYQAASAQADDLFVRSYSDSDGRRWYQGAIAFNEPGRLKAEVGYQVGAAGVALSLIRFHQSQQLHDNGKESLIARLPEDPYPTRCGV